MVPLLPIGVLFTKSMEKILERYERYSYAERALTLTDLESQGNWVVEFNKLKTKTESLQKSQRHLMGEQLDSLNLKELGQLEQQLESSLKNVRSRQSQLMLNSIAELQKKIQGPIDNSSKKNMDLKGYSNFEMCIGNIHNPASPLGFSVQEKTLRDRNKVLEKEYIKKAKAKALTQQEAQWEQQTSSSSPSSLLLTQDPPSLNIGNYQARSNENDAEAAQQSEEAPIGSSLLPPWMLGHLKA